VADTFRALVALEKGVFAFETELPFVDTERRHIQAASLLRVAYIYMYICIFLSLSLSIYIYIYIYSATIRYSARRVLDVLAFAAEGVSLR